MFCATRSIQNKSDMVLNIRNFSLFIHANRRCNQLLHDVSLSISTGERVAIVGASGAGKTILTRALLSILPPKATVDPQSIIQFQGQDLYKNGLPVKDIKPSMAIILQDPHTSLNPALRIEEQVAEVLPKGLTRSEQRARVLEILQTVYLDDPERVSGAYPFELSGGMAQRVMIAIMLSLNPQLLIADEPTSALDAPVGIGIMRLIIDKIQKRNASFLLISHDINMVKNFCDRIVVMSHGKVVEVLSVADLHNAQHPKTQQLLNIGKNL